MSTQGVKLSREDSCKKLEVMDERRKAKGGRVRRLTSSSSSYFSELNSSRSRMLKGLEVAS